MREMSGVSNAKSPNLTKQVKEYLARNKDPACVKEPARLEMAGDVEQRAMWCRLAAPMGCLLKRVALVLLIAACFVGRDSVASDPISDFFKRLGNSIAHPHSSPTPRHSQQKSATGKEPNHNQSTPPKAPPAARSVLPTPTPTPKPTPLPVRTAAGVPPSSGPQRDVPYGIPVPNKPGFVTSPYAPKSGYVDVRGFPSGSEVKDPFTGKIFLTP
jgi:hypothetical protein